MFFFESSRLNHNLEPEVVTDPLSKESMSTVLLLLGHVTLFATPEIARRFVKHVICKFYYSSLPRSVKKLYEELDMDFPINLDMDWILGSHQDCKNESNPVSKKKKEKQDKAPLLYDPIRSIRGIQAHPMQNLDHFSRGLVNPGKFFRMISVKRKARPASEADQNELLTPMTPRKRPEPVMEIVICPETPVKKIPRHIHSHFTWPRSPSPKKCHSFC